MKYVFLAYQEEEQLDAMSVKERAAFKDACRANEQDLRRSGHLYAMEDLQSSGTTVRFMNGKVTVTDSPFVETKGLSLRLFLIDARDLNVAIQIASQMPQSRFGIVEVRTILEFDPVK